MKRIWYFLRGGLALLLSLVLLANLWLLAARFLWHDDLPHLLGYCQAIVVSGSMEPTCSAGDLLIFREQEQYALQDVVIFRQGSAFVTHRIVAATPSGFTTKGDANNSEDREPLDPQLIEGALVAVVPGVGDALTFLRTPLGILSLILVGLALLEGPELIQLIGKRS